MPDQVVEGLAEAGSAKEAAMRGKKILDGYLGLLNVGTKFSAKEGNSAASTSNGQTLSLVTLSPAVRFSSNHTTANY